MEWFSTLIVMFQFTCAFGAGPPPITPCPGFPGYSILDQSCFGIFTQAVTWDQAESNCQQDGGRLTSILGELEMIYVWLLIERDGLTSAWLGGRNQSGQTKWADGTAMLYTEWAPSEPSGSGDCVMFSKAAVWGYREELCYNLHPYVCRKGASSGNGQSLLTMSHFIRVSHADVSLGPDVPPISDNSMISELGCARICGADPACLSFDVKVSSGGFHCETCSVVTRPSPPVPEIKTYVKSNP